jgi:hypothetical protein
VPAVDDRRGGRARIANPVGPYRVPIDTGGINASSIGDAIRPVRIRALMPLS